MGANYSFNSQANTFFIRDFGYFNAQGTVALFQGINITGSLSALSSGGINSSQMNTLNDTIYGNSYVDYLKGGPGSDVVFGAGGNDTILGDADNERPLRS